LWKETQVTKYFASDRGVRAVDIEGARTGVKKTLKPDSKGFYNVESARDAKALKESGFVEASLMGVASAGTGHICGGCGFNGFFKLCGRCGKNNAETGSD